MATAPRSKRAEVEACGLPQGSLGGIPPLAETARGRPGRPFSRAFLSFAVTSRIHLKVQLPSADSGILLKGPVCPRVRTRVGAWRRGFPSPAGWVWALFRESHRPRRERFKHAPFVWVNRGGQRLTRPAMGRVGPVRADAHAPCVSLTVSHHVCEQAPEQAELGGDGAGDPGKRRPGLNEGPSVLRCWQPALALTPGGPCERAWGHLARGSNARPAAKMAPAPAPGLSQPLRLRSPGLSEQSSTTGS